jgi:hypothetical protein
VGPAASGSPDALIEPAAAGTGPPAAACASEWARRPLSGGDGRLSVPSWLLRSSSREVRSDFDRPDSGAAAASRFSSTMPTLRLRANGISISSTPSANTVTRMVSDSGPGSPPSSASPATTAPTTKNARFCASRCQLDQR